MTTSKKLSIKSSIILLAAVVGAVFLSRYLTKDGLFFYPKFIANSAGYLFTKVENLGGFMEKIKNFSSLAEENDKLKQDIGSLLSLKAKVDNLEDENDFLRRAARISQKLDSQIIYAGVFNLNLAPAGYNVLLNKGVGEGISEGDIVITAEGILVGKINKVARNFSRVLFISDPEFKVTSKVINSDTTGIAKGALGDGMYLDFIVQEDEIKEGDLLISTGSDLFPPALIIGFVGHVEINTTQMFKKIRIRPAVEDVKLGRVLVIIMSEK